MLWGSWLSDKMESNCWVSGHTFATCCYGKGDCFDPERYQRCCAVPFASRPAKFMTKLSPLSINLLQQVLALNSLTPSQFPVAATYLVHESWKQARIQLDRVRNHTTEGELPLMDAAFGATSTYFVSLHALHRSIRGMQAMLRREGQLWSRFTDIYTAAWGQRDFCRCVEAAEFYSRAGAQLLQSGVGSLHFPRVFLNSSLWEHQVLSLQNCRLQDEISLEAETLLRTAFSSQCLPGDLSTMIGLLHGCILERNLAKVLSLQEGIFQLATFAADCLDTQVWGFSVRDAALHHARSTWYFLRKMDTIDVFPVKFDAALQKRLAWVPTSSLFRQSLASAGTGSAWHAQCGPHFLESVQILPPSQQTRRPVLQGPLCTEHGRFWLDLNHRSAPTTLQAPHGILVVLPITMSWEANPWHHVHWWLPLLYFVKIFLHLDPSQVDVALAFPHGDIDFARSTARGRDLDPDVRGHTEPSAWSVLQHDFPFQGEKAMRHWSPEGIHAGLLKWISDRPAMALAKYYGRSYEQVIMGLPSLRSFLQTPQIPCTSLSQVKRWVQHQLPQTAGSREGLLRLALLQRAEADGRRIQNYDQVLDFVRGRHSHALEVKEVTGLAHGTPWVEQFQALHDVDILLGVHGAGLAWLWALPEGSAVVEMRSRSSPMWLQCSDLWNADFTQIFGGLARLAGIHHLCTRPHDIMGTWTEGRLSNVGDLTDADAYNHSDDVYVSLAKAQQILDSAISMVRGEPLPCLTYHWWI